MTKDELKNIDFSKTLLIDIREDEEVKAEPSINGSIHIPMSVIMSKVDAHQLPKDKKIITVCRSGGRCLMLNQFLTEQGYDVDFLEGGMMDLKSD